jgi:predicted transposase/invertase (TIGR01784 family)
MDTIRTKDGGDLLSPKNDYLFKRLFGDPRNRPVLNGFLHDFLDLGDEEFEVELIDTHVNPEFAEDKMSILDVRLKTKLGKQVDVEMQVLETANFFEHIIYYQSRMVTDQIGKGDWSGDIKKVINIVISDFDFIKGDNYYHCYRLHDKKDDTYFGDFEEIHVLELRKLPEKSDGTQIWNWGKFIGAKSEEDIMMTALNNPAIEKAAEALREASGDEAVRKQYDLRQHILMDEYARTVAAERKGEERILDLLRSGKSAEEILRAYH